MTIDFYLDAGLYDLGNECQGVYMEKKILNKEGYPESQKNDRYLVQCPDHRKGDRRACSGKGFTYITMVGWMCRREQSRRKNDKFDPIF